MKLLLFDSCKITAHSKWWDWSLGQKELHTGQFH